MQAISMYVHVPRELIEKGQKTLDWLLPRESETKETDRALLSLIWPYDVASPKQSDAILKNVEKKLVREGGL